MTFEEERIIIENVKIKIYTEIESLRLSGNAVWKFQNYTGFIEREGIPQEYFYKTMQELCEEGQFTAMQDRSVNHYRLTKKGFEETLRRSISDQKNK